jgi:SnoaL-like domain
MNVKTLEQRVRAIEDGQEIQNLKSAYLKACNGGWDRPSHNAGLVAATFAEDGCWEAQGFARLVGREAIRNAFEAFSRQVPFAFHTVSNPFITVDGDVAAGEWHLTEMFTNVEGEELWAGGVYTDRFVRTHGQWLIESLSLTYAYSGPYGTSWAKSIKAAMDTSA